MLTRLLLITLVFVAGIWLGWTLQERHDSGPLPQPALELPPPLPVTPPVEDTARPQPHDRLAYYLQEGDLDAAVNELANRQLQGDEAAIAATRAQLLAHARDLLRGGHHDAAGQMLRQMLLIQHRDVEVGLLLAEVQAREGDLQAAIEQLYQTRGHAWQPDTLAQITRRIRQLVEQRAGELTTQNDAAARLALYRYLVEQEPDHAAYFIGLAQAQLALDDVPAARRSLTLVRQDPDVGAQAQALLERLGVDAATGQGSDTAAVTVTGIPLVRQGHHFIVAAQPARARAVDLLIDTGASLTILTPAVFERPGLRYTDTGRRGVFYTANGPVEAPVYRLASLAVGDWQVESLEVGVLDLGEQTGIDGLLGMNFLRHFRFFIDQNTPELMLTAD